MSDPIVIVSAARTPIGSMLGEFTGLQGWQLGATAIKAAVERAGLKPEQVQEVIMGCCLMAGQGQAPELTRAIQYRRINLVADPAPPGRFDLVLCRNVLLYLSPALKAQVFATLAGALRPGGLLILGAGETVIGQTRLFEPSRRFRGLYERAADRDRGPDDEAADGAGHARAPHDLVVDEVAIAREQGLEHRARCDRTVADREARAGDDHERGGEADSEAHAAGRVDALGQLRSRVGLLRGRRGEGGGAHDTTSSAFSRTSASSVSHAACTV